MTATEAAPRLGIDPVQWPDVAVVPRSPVRAAVARALFRRAATKLPAERRPAIPSGHVCLLDCRRCACSPGFVFGSAA